MFMAEEVHEPSSHPQLPFIPPELYYPSLLTVCDWQLHYCHPYLSFLFLLRIATTVIVSFSALSYFHRYLPLSSH